MVEAFLKGVPEKVDLTNTSHLELVKEKANELLSLGLDESGLIKLRKSLDENNSTSATLPLLAVKLARSKRIVESYNEPLKVSVVFAVYKEQNRIRTKAEHHHGEDFLLRKVSQLNWLFSDTQVEWELIVVDDGCPENSGRIAQEIIEENNLAEKVKVLFLQNAIDQNLSITKGIRSTDESRKGGSIIYGMWHASQKSNSNNHIILFTDADLSTHLGQTGLLLGPIIKVGMSVTIGSRRETDSVVVKQGSRNDRGKLFIYLWKRLVPELSYLIDTQCGFKAFRKETVAAIVDNMIERKFAFDIELLLKTELRQSNSIAKVGIAWIDSEAASTTTDLQPYLSMLKAIAAMYRKYIIPNPESDSFASFIERINEADFQRLLTKIPSEITSREPIEFATFRGVDVAQLEEFLEIE